MMGLSWINPLYLAGLLLLALPVLIHLVQKHLASGTRFPSLMFLQRIPQRQKRRMQIRNWPLLLLRCLLLLLIVLAFARPFLDASGAAAGLDPGRSDSVIVLDRSLSMRIDDRWPQARAAALKLVAEKRPLDRIGVVLFDDETELLGDLTSDAGDLRALLQGPAPGYRATRMTGAVEQAARLLAGSNASRKRIFVVSDFQAEAAAVPRIAADIEVSALPVETGRIANAALTSVTLEASSRAAADEFALLVEVSNHGERELAQALTLSVDGREVARRELTLAPGARVAERFDRLGAGSDLLRGVVSLDDDDLALDNRSFFVYSSNQQLPLLVVEGPAARAHQSLYLEGALRQARAPVLRIERKRLDELRATELAAWAAIVLNDIAIPAGELGEALAAYVAAGGALLVASGEAAPRDWPSGTDGYLPGKPGRRVDAKRGTAFGIGDFDPAHPLSADLAAPVASGLSLARVFSYREFMAAPQDRVVARYGDGNAALLERRVGAGRVLLLTTTLDTHWNDLALQPGFVPFLHQALRYITAYEAYPQQSAIGSIIDVMRYARALAGADAIVAAADAAPLIVETPSASAIRLDRRAPLLTLTEPGFYQVHRATPGDVEVTLAANIDAREANRQVLDVDRFVEEIRASAGPPAAAAVLTRRQAVEYEQQQQLWYLVLSLVLGLVLVEALAANWMGARQSPRKAARAG